MSLLVIPVCFAIVSCVTGGVTRSVQEVDSALSSSHPGWEALDYGSHGHGALLPAQLQSHEAALWKDKEFTKAKALADHHAAVAAWKAKAAAEEQSRALAFQSAVEAKAAADQEVGNALLKAGAAAEEEARAKYAARQAELMAEDASLAAISAQNVAEQLNKSFLAAQARSKQEADAAAEKSKFADETKQKAALASEARRSANEAAALAAQKVKSADEALWQAKHAAWSW